MRDRTLLIEFESEFEVASWAPYGGGCRKARLVANHQVLQDDRAATEQPEIYLSNLFGRLGLNADCAVAMMTGADVSRARHQTLYRNDLAVACWVTAGCSNALTVGDPATYEAGSIGTINIIVAINQPMSPVASLEAIQIATEARVLALRISGIESVVSGQIATGTGTDCIAIAAPVGLRAHRYCGKHTILAELIGKSVLSSCEEALRTRNSGARV